MLIDIFCQCVGIRWQRHSCHVACHCGGYQATCVGACRVVRVQSSVEVLRQVVFSYHDGCEVVAPLLVQRVVQPVTGCTTVCFDYFNAAQLTCLFNLVQAVFRGCVMQAITT
jgi:hypothetical protein